MSRTSTTAKIIRGNSVPTLAECFALLCAILFTVIFFLTPYQHDDFWYINPFRDWKLGGGMPFSLSDGWWSVVWHWEHDNGRLANISTPLTLVLLPKWVFNLLSGVVIWLTFRLSVILGSYRVRRDTAADLGVICFLILFLPWFNELLTADFCLNYEWSGLGMLFFIWLILYADRFRAFPLWLKCIIWLSLPLAGMMHEAASACGIAAGVVLLLLTVGPRKARIILLLLYASGFIATFLSPSTLNKISCISESDWGRFLRPDNYYASFMFYILVLEVAICLCVPAWRRRLSARTSIALPAALFACALTDEAIMQFSGYQLHRVTYFGFIPAIIDIFLIARTAGLRMPCPRILSGMLVAASLVNLTVSIYWQEKLLRQYEEVTALLQTTKSAYIPYDYLVGPDISPLVLGKPLKNQFHIGWYGINSFYRPDKRVSLIPTILASTDVNKGVPLEGTRGACRIRNHIVIQDHWDYEREGITYCTVRYSDGSSLFTSALLMTYFSGPHTCTFLMMNQPRKYYSKTPVGLEMPPLEYIAPYDTARVANRAQEEEYGPLY